MTDSKLWKCTGCGSQMSTEQIKGTGFNSCCPERNMQPDRSVLIDARKLIIVTENHGGYKGGTCVHCDASGWIDRIKHKPECPVPAALAGIFTNG